MLLMKVSPCGSHKDQRYSVISGRGKNGPPSTILSFSKSLWLYTVWFHGPFFSRDPITGLISTVFSNF